MRFAPWAALALAMTNFVGCSDGAPLGGPYGGTGSPPGPGLSALPGFADGGSSAILDGQVEGAIVEAGSGDSASDGTGPVTSEGGETSVAVAPTWTAIFNSYLTMCKTCHIEMSSASSGYSWLQTQDFIDGAFSPLVSPAQSCLSWYGGDMPPGGMADAAAVTVMNAWAAAGALNN